MIRNLPFSNIKHGDNARADAETHDRTVWVFPRSAEVMVYTLWQPNSAITLPGLWTTVTPVSSALNICIGLDITFNLP